MSPRATALLFAALGTLGALPPAAAGAPVRVLLQELPPGQRLALRPPAAEARIEEIGEVLVDVGPAGAAPAAADARPTVDRPGGFAVIAYRGLRGRVSKVEGDRVEIDVGSKQGAQKDMEFAVYRDGSWVGLLRIDAVAASGSACTPVAGRRTGAEAPAAWAFAPGDEVRQREDALGAGLADEAEARGRVLGWQRERDRFERERRRLEEREAEILLGLRTSTTVAASLQHLENLTALGGESAAWRARYVAWLDTVLKERETRLAGNPHVAAYRTALAESAAIDEEEARWREVRLGLIRGVFAAAKKIDDLVKEGTLAVGKTARHNQSAARREAEKYDAAIEERAGRIDENFAALEELQGDLERWEAQDRVFLARRAARRAQQVETIVNRARFALLRGFDLSAARLYRQALALEVQGAALNAARAGLELARLRLVLKGESADARSGFAPPLAVDWERAVPGDLRGEPVTDGELLIACFADTADPERTVVRAVHGDTGELAWEQSVTGRPGGRMLLAEGELLLPSDRGVLHRLRAADGEPLVEYDLGTAGRTASRLDRDGERILWTAALELPGTIGRQIVARIDAARPEASRLLAVHGSLAAVLPVADDSLVIAGAVRPDGTGAPAAVAAPLAAALPLLPGKGKRPGLTGHMSLVAVLGGVSLTGGGEQLWAFPGASVQWAGVGAGHLVASVVSTPEKTGLDPVSHVLFLGTGPARSSNWRLSLPKRDAVADMVADGSRVYLLLRDAWLIAVDVRKREVLWTADLPVATAGGLRWARFLASDDDQLVFWCGGAAPPWTVYAVSKEGFVAAETRVPRGDLALPLWRDGNLYSAERDGSLAARHPARDGLAWRFSPVADGDLFGPRRHEDVGERVSRDFGDLPWEDRQRKVWETTFGGDRGDGHQPLAFVGDRLVFWCSRNRHLIALVPEGKPR